MLGLHEYLAVPLYDEGVVRPDVHSFSWDAPSPRTTEAGWLGLELWPEGDHIALAGRGAIKQARKGPIAILRVKPLG